MSLETCCNIAIETICWSAGEYIMVEDKQGHQYAEYPEHYLEVYDRMISSLTDSDEYDCDYELEELDTIAKKHLKDLGYNYDHVA